MSPLLRKVHTELDVPQRLAATTRTKSLHWALFILSVTHKVVSPGPPAALTWAAQFLLIKKKLWATCLCDPLYFLSQVLEHMASFSLIDSRGNGRVLAPLDLSSCEPVLRCWLRASLWDAWVWIPGPVFPSYAFWCKMFSFIAPSAAHLRQGEGRLKYQLEACARMCMDNLDTWWWITHTECWVPIISRQWRIVLITVLTRVRVRQPQSRQCRFSRFLRTLELLAYLLVTGVAIDQKSRGKPEPRLLWCSALRFS